jgi:hypothetical protein
VNLKEYCTKCDDGMNLEHHYGREFCPACHINEAEPDNLADVNSHPRFEGAKIPKGIDRRSDNLQKSYLLRWP